MINAGAHKLDSVYGNIIKKMLSCITLLLLLTVGADTAFAQSTDYSGIYYIASVGYNSANTTTNYYLCPTEGWAFYVSDNNVTGTDNGKPFLTTYQCRNGIYDASKAVWIIEKAPAPNSDYYYIKQHKTGKYIVSNGAICNNPDRARIHLEQINDPDNLDDNALFSIYLYNNSYLVIMPKGITDGASTAHKDHDKHKWLTVNQGNKPNLDGTNAKTDGPSSFPNTGGILGLYTEGDANAKFYLEEYIQAPTIFYNTSNQIEITAQSDATIIYTTNGTEPSATNGTVVNSNTTSFAPTADGTIIKAIAVVAGYLSKRISTFTLPVLCGSENKRLIQNQNNAWNSTDFHFYMIPGDEASGVIKVNTTSLFRPTMEWYFMSAGMDNGVQYYYIINKANGKSLCYDTSNTANGVYMDTNSDNSNKFKFSIAVSPTAGTYNIVPYGLTTGNRFINKTTDNANNSAIGLANSNSGANARWKFVLPSDLDRNAPFTVSVPGTGSYSYYKIANVTNNDYYIVPGATNAMTSNSSDASVVNTMNWFFEVVQAADDSDWLTYYHIRNAVTGDYLYFNKDGNNAGPCLEMRSTIESGNEDRYMFTWAKTADAYVNYYIIPKNLKDVSHNQFSSLRKHDSNTSIITNVTRGAGRFAWTFVSSSYTCAQPEITYDPAQNGYVITSTEKDAKFYYTIGNGALTPSTGTLYTGIISVADWDMSSATIRVIAARNGDNSDASSESSVIVNRVATPTITLTDDGKVLLNCATDDAVLYYEIGNPGQVSNPTTGSTQYNGPIENAVGKVIKVIAVKGGWINSVVETSQTIVFKCAIPVIRKTSPTTFTIFCGFPASGVTIRYTIGDGTQDAPTASTGTVYNGAVTFSISDLPFTIKAIATADGYTTSEISIRELSENLMLDDDGYYEIANDYDFGKFIEMVNRNDADKNYKITDDITVSNPSEIEVAFSGILTSVAKADGTLPVIKGMNHAIFQSINGGTVKNIILDNVTIDGSGNIGAIANEATGDSRIYNCGVLATSSTVVTDDDGYTTITNCSSTIRGSGYVGGIVGLLDGSSRVINCFNYANVSGGTHVGGIVGYNNVATTATNLKTMVMNCMFYGEVSGTSIAPIYNGQIITNVGENTGVSNFNYFRLESSYIQNTSITKVYNCALGAETRFLQRFEFYRHLLNSNRELAAWWATGNAANKDEIMKWVMDPSQIGSSTPYPILKSSGKYASVVNYTPNDTVYDAENRNKGRKLTSIGTSGKLAVTIQSGSGGATGAEITTSSLNLTITDKDYKHFNFNYGKVQLPYYNDVGTNNYTDGKVVTGWKIVSITGGTAGSYTTGAANAPADVTYDGSGNLTATPYNFADRNCTNKDLYGTGGSNRVFNQGAYWDVPEGVTAITIQPYWGKAVYLGDAYLDVVYNDVMDTPYDVTTVGGGQRYDNGVSTFNDNDQLVYTTITDAVTALNPSGTVYDNAVVLVGNYHQYCDGTNVKIEGGNKPYTVTSVDLDHDNEPDYSFILRFDGRTTFHPARYDFLNLIGLGMAQKSTGGTGSYNFGIMQPKYWFEVTNTALFHATQFEYSKSRVKNPYILQGGVIEQWVTQQDNAGDGVSYFHIGGNVWFKEFQRGSHQDNPDKSTPHPPVSVTGGDFDKFYLTGLYQSQAAIYDDNAECYINGGRFGEIAGAGMEGIGITEGNGNVTWIIDNADIREFYGGGINFAKPVYGNIHTIISNSYVDRFCGGPKFGDMESGRTVTTTATNCTFGTYFGAGYGGNAYNRYAPSNQFGMLNTNWNDWVNTEYTQSYSDTYGGVSAQIEYQFIPMSNNTNNVARLFVDFVGFSLATCRDVTSYLTGCRITGNFYGGGSLGKVAGPVTSTLTNCTVDGSVFGAGYSASLPTVEVMNTGGFQTEPHYYQDLGTYRTGVLPATTTYTWQHKDDISSTSDAIDKNGHILYTTEDLTSLGTITGMVTLNIEGTTAVTGNVYGGGESSDVAGGVTVNIDDGTVTGDVYGGGALANTNTANYNATTGVVQPTLNTTTVNLNGGRVRNAYGGGLGNPDTAAIVYGNVQVVLDGTYLEPGYKYETHDGLIDTIPTAGMIFGCNNVNGTPKGSVLVHVKRTVNAQGLDNAKPKTQGGDKGSGVYELSAVYGGGNLAEYIPSDDSITHVIIEGCNATSIMYVYGGGNAASVAGTSVKVYGAYEIGYVFGGGNGAGADNPGANVGYHADVVNAQNQTVPGSAYGTGTTIAELYRGTIYQAYGGSNTRGNIRASSTLKLDEEGDVTGYDYCDSLHVGQTHGGGNKAYMDGSSNIILGCIKYMPEIYGGARSADVGNDVVLTITSGRFDRVFGGNNEGGTINGSITINIEETGCHPIEIGALYGGGNMAPYVTPAGKDGPTLNIKSCTRIDTVYGGGNMATVEGDTHVNINMVKGSLYSNDTDPDNDEPSTAIGSIGVVFGGGNNADVIGDTYVNIGTLNTVPFESLPTGQSGTDNILTVEGAQIEENVYGGGNNANVTGATHIQIGP